MIQSPERIGAKGCIHRHFQRQAARRPEAIAVICEDRRLTYDALNRAANRLAHHLMELGVGPETPVAISMARSERLVIALLGVLKAGGAYLLVDPDLPVQRQRLMLDETAPPVVVCDGQDTPVALDAGVRTVDLAARSDALASASDANPVSAVGVDNLAYFTYTSGTTGRPKAAEIPHRAIAGFFTGVEYARFDENQVFLQHSAISWDALTLELWPALLTGARSVIVPGPPPAPADLARAIRIHDVSILWLTAALFNVFIDSMPEALAGVRQILTGGEALSLPHIRRASRLLPNTHLVNGYGPSECTVFASCHPNLTDLAADRLTVPIGRPIGDRRVYLLDRWLRRVPIGVEGELYVGGPAVCRGYLQRPALTAEKLVPDPFCREVPGARMYRTGDQAHYLSDGTLEFRGRVDHQIKLRGFRIELPEIEAALGRCAGVARCAVALHQDEGGAKRLLAYLEARNGQPPSLAELRTQLARELPGYMIPGAFVFLEKLPMGPTGKLDRHALPAPDTTRPEVASTYVAPREPAQVLLSEIWCETLQLDKVGIHDNYFELGGDSIQAIQIVNRAAKRGLRFSPRDIFAHQTVAELACNVETTDDTSTPATEQDPAAGEVALTPIQRWFFDAAPAEIDHFNQSVLLCVDPAVTARDLQAAVAAVGERHDSLRLRFVQGSSLWRQEYVGTRHPLPLQRVDLSRLGSAARAAALEAAGSQAHASLSLSSGPIARAVFFDLGAESGRRLFLVAHHLAVDGISWRILLEELHVASSQRLLGQQIDLGPKGASYQLWSRSLARAARDSALAGELEHWHQLLEAPLVPLPIDRPGGDNRVVATDFERKTLDEESTRAFLRDAGRAYGTRSEELLLTALASALRRWLPGAEDLEPGAGVLLHLEGHGREELVEALDLSRTVGWFSAIYPFVLPLGAPAWRSAPGELLREVKERLRRVPRRGAGFGLLRYLTADDHPELAALPPADIAFNYLGRFDQTLPATALYSFASEATGSELSPQGQRRHALEIVGLVSGGRLELQINFSRGLHRRASIETLAALYAEEIEALLRHCLSPHAGGYTPSDFPLAALDQTTLDLATSRPPRQPGNEIAGRWIEDLYPLSPTQEGMLFHYIYDPASRDYFDQLHCELVGDVDEAAFERAWLLLAERHAVLRTSLVWEGLDRPLQRVEREVSLEVEWLDWTTASDREAASRLEQLLDADRHRGFDLTTAPLMRLNCARLGNDRRILVWSFHHLLLDGWSVSMLVDELFAAYEAFRRDRSPRLPDRRPYRDYIEWLGRQSQDPAERFWRRYLAALPAATPLPLRSAKPGPVTGLGVEHLELERDASQALARLARNRRLTLNTVVLGAWGLVLSRLSGEPDVVFGITASGRPTDLEGAADMLGLFINTLPVRCRVDGGETVEGWLAKLQEEQVELRIFEHSPLVDIARWSERDTGGSLFESLLVFESYPIDQVWQRNDPGLEVRNVDSREQTNYPLTLVAFPGDHLSLRIDYACESFTRGNVRRLLGHLRVVLAAMAAAPAGRLREIPLLTATERNEAIHRWNDQEAVFPPGEPIHRRFQQQAARRPSAPAVTFDGNHLSFGRIERRSNRLAHHLRRLGAGPGRLIGLWLDRSAELVVAILAILKTGAAYLPIDPDYPADRVSFMLADSGCRLLVSQTSYRRQVGDWGGHTLWLDDAPGLAAESDADPAIAVAATDAAYCIYTSGTTGRPKGTVVTHANVTRLLAATQPWFQFGETDVWTLFHSVAFDFSVWEIWGSLLHGGRLVVVPYWVSRSPADFLDLLLEEHVTVLNQTPSAFYELAGADSSTVAPVGRGLRWVIFGGEALEVSRLHSWFERHGDQQPRLVNMYGITETTVHVTYRPIERGLATEASPIGLPIPDLQVYTVDPCLEPQPLGVAGEILIGGAGVCRGYLGRPRLTAERFVPDPFSGQPGARLYRSGDLGRRQPDGELEYLGRIDDQVKVRGFRIELREIEAVLEEHPAVDRAVLLLRALHADPASAQGLVAYWTGGRASVGELRDFLAVKLPSYMVPSAFIEMEALPLTAHGKLDRRALPAPEAARVPREQPTVAPRNELEEQLAGIWQTVLGVEALGVEDDFFALGGDSLLTIQIVARAAGAGLRLSPRQVSENPTIAALARIARGERVPPEDGAAESAGRLLVSAPAARPAEGIEDVYGASQMQTLMLDHYIAAPVGSGVYHCQHLNLVQATDFRLSALAAALTALMQRHPVLRATFDRVDGRWRQTIRSRPRLPLEVEDLRRLGQMDQNARLNRWWEEDRSCPLGGGPEGLLFRLRVFVLAHDRFAVAMSFHHAIIDGWGHAAMLGQLTDFFSLATKGRPISVEAAANVHKEYIALEGQLLDSQEAASFWQRQLAGFEPAVPPRPADGVPGFGSAWRSLDETTLRAVYDRHTSNRVSLKAVLLDAYLELMAEWLGRDDVAVGVVANGRTPALSDPLGAVGLFWNMVPFRRPSAGPTDSSLVSVHRALVALEPHAAYPLSEIRVRTRLEELFFCSFNFVHFHNTPDPGSHHGTVLLETRAFDRLHYPLNFALEVVPRDGAIQLSIEYDRSRIEDEVVSSLADRYLTILLGQDSEATMTLEAQ